MTEPTSTAATSGCGQAASAGSSTLAVSIDGHKRVVMVHIPTDYAATKRASLVLNMHGSSSTAQEQEALSSMDTTADREGFIAAYPQGLIVAGSGFDWNVPSEPLFGGSFPPKGAPDDVAFLTDLVPELASRYCIDLHGVYATGLSGGGRMASQLACDSPRTFAAVAPVAGLRFPSPCPTGHAVPVIAFHGTADPIDPYGGNGQAYWTYSVPVAAQRWAAQNGCGATPRTTTGSGYKLTTYSECSGRAGVELYTLIGEGHEWPGGPILPTSVAKVLGPQTDAVDANTTMWSFFAAHRPD